MIWQKASLGSQFERFLATEKWLKFLKKNSDLYDSLAQLVEHPDLSGGPCFKLMRNRLMN
jgi:hypothetical protein